MRYCGGNLPGIAVAALIGIGAMAHGARAYDVSATVGFTVSNGTNGGLTGWSFTGVIPQFINTLSGINADCHTGDTCTLTGVSVTITDTATGYVTFTGPDNPNGSLTGILIGSKVAYYDPLSLSNVVSTTASYDICSSDVSLSGNATCNALLDSLSFAANQQITATLTSAPTNSSTYTSNSSSILNEIIAGAISFTGSTASYVSGDDSNNVQQNPNVTAQISGTVDYTYTDTPPQNPVPEPASLATLGAGLVGLVLVRRRRRS